MYRQARQPDPNESFSSETTPKEKKTPPKKAGGPHEDQARSKDK
jgi:hypothetical protein